MNTRIGFGYDIHRLEAGRKLMVGGIEIPWHKGCSGHSDGDPLIHAICDAILGAASAGDIGQHFPDHSPEFKNIDSRILLRKTIDIARSFRYKLIQADTTVCLERPKLSPFIPSMIEQLAGILDVPADHLSIKAKTGEKIGFVGREEGIAAYAVVLLERIT